MTQPKGFKEPNMPPPKPIGPWSAEDQERIVAYQKRLYLGTPLVDKSPPPKPKKPKEERTGGYAGSGDGRRQRKYDVKAIVEAYQQGSTPKEISEDTGANHATVIEYLKAEGVWKPNKRYGGRTPKDRCIRNHDLTNPDNVRVRTKPDGSPRGRECKLCIRERNQS